MIYALRDNNRITANPGETAKCPCCYNDVIAKCGNINVWHWAHKTVSDGCDYKPETPWHLFWKSFFPPERCEVRIEKDGKFKIADGVTSGGYIVEFQNSPISYSEIKERERFYGEDNMFWVFNEEDAYFNERLDIRKKDSNEFYTFRWKHPHKTLHACKSPVFLDLGSYSRLIFRLKKLYPETPSGGWGYLDQYEKMIDYLKK